MTSKYEKCNKVIGKRLPFISVLKSYAKSDFYNDSIAGLTVALLIIPQGLAYGLVAGLTPNHGLYSAFIGSFVYFLLGTTKEINIGPTAIMSLMTLPYALKGGADYTIFITFACGVIQILAAILNLGFLLNFISTPVISGFTTAAAITIASSQVKGIFGLKILSGSFVVSWKNVITNIASFKIPDFLLGCCCIAVLLFLKNLRSIVCRCQNKHEGKCLTSGITFLMLGRNALVVITTSLLAYFTVDKKLFNLTGKTDGGIPQIAFPPLSSQRDNNTLSFLEMVSDIGIGLGTIPFISTLDHIAVVGAFSSGKNFDATQEMLAVGMVNLIGSFFGSMPTTASLSRTAVNMASGVKTTAGGILTGTIVLLSLAFLTDYFGFIPSATLSSIIICAVLQMIDLKMFTVLWEKNKLELIPLTVTFMACLILGLELGILSGIAANTFILLYQVATPKISTSNEMITVSGNKYIKVKPHAGIIYPNAASINVSIQKAGLKKAEGKFPVIVDGSKLTKLDFTAAKGLRRTAEVFEGRNQFLAFVSLNSFMEEVFKKESVINIFENMKDIEDYIDNDLLPRTTSDITV